MSFSHTVQNASLAYPLSPITLRLSLSRQGSPKEGAATGNVPDEKRRLGYCECLGLCCHDMHNVTIATNFAPLRSMPIHMIMCREYMYILCVSGALSQC